MAMQTASHPGSKSNNERDISKHFSVTPAQAAAAVAWVNQKSVASASNAVPSSGKSPRMVVDKSPSMKTRSMGTLRGVPRKIASRRSAPPKVGWGQRGQSEGRAKTKSRPTTRKLTPSKYRRRKKRSRISTSMVSEITKLIIKVLQLKGAMTVTALAEQLCCKQEDVQNVLNVLTTTPLVNKVKLVTSKASAQTEHCPGFVYRDGVPLDDHVEMSDLQQQLARERDLTEACKRRIATIQQELDKHNTSAKALLCEVLATDSEIRSDPFYRVVFKRCNFT